MKKIFIINLILIIIIFISGCESNNKKIVCTMTEQDEDMGSITSKLVITINKNNNVEKTIRTTTMKLKAEDLAQSIYDSYKDSYKDNIELKENKVIITEEENSEETISKESAIESLEASGYTCE